MDICLRWSKVPRSLPHDGQDFNAGSMAQLKVTENLPMGQKVSEIQFSSFFDLSTHPCVSNERI